MVSRAARSICGACAVDEEVRPDAQRTLHELNEEWEGCRRCLLGTQRESLQGSFVRGEGRTRGIMFIGEGPGANEDEEGRPFVGKSGEVLRNILAGLRFEDYYITNLVACRSCEPRLDADSQPMFRRRGGRKGPMIPMMQDVPPKPSEWHQCIKRLYQEIYLVDPVIIVSLGGTAAEALIGKPVTITAMHGNPVEIRVPGAGYEAQLTEKKGVWYRKVKGEVRAPVEQAQVKYLLIPTLHPAYVLRKIADKGADSPIQHLVRDIRRAIETYEMYIEEVFQTKVQPRVEGDLEPRHSTYNEEA